MRGYWWPPRHAAGAFGGSNIVYLWRPIVYGEQIEEKVGWVEELRAAVSEPREVRHGLVCGPKIDSLALAEQQKLIEVRENLR